MLMRPLIALSSVLLFGCASAASPDADGFVPLFNGKDFTGWARVNCAHETFRVEGGIIISTGKPTGVMRTERMYENYVIELDWKHMKERGNAGLFIHSGAVPVRGQPFTKGHEIQVLDGDSPDGTWTGHGDVFSIHGATFEPDRPHPKGWMRCLPSEKRANPVGQWNHYRVVVNNGSVKLEVNGKEVSGGTKCNPRKGYICLESEGSECHFRNIRIKELPSTNATAEETGEADQGFKSLYTGLDFRGWNTESAKPGTWNAKDWVFEGAAAAEMIWSEKEYKNFDLLFDWRSPKGRASFQLKGNFAIHLAEGKPNEWHRVHITVKKGQSTVVDNDTTLVQDQAKALLGIPGPIGLQPFGDRVQFANVFVKELD